MTTATVKYDANALTLGQWVMRETGAEIAILFGSRARGDYRRDSDIDLLLVHPLWDEIRRRAKEAATAKAESLYGRWMEVNLAWFTPQEFEHLQRTINGVAAIAIEEGFTMDGQPAGNEYGNDQEDYSNESSQTEQRCHHTRSHLHLFRGAIDLAAANIMIGQQAHQTLEHAMKALISASGQRYPHHHDLVDLEQTMSPVRPWVHSTTGVRPDSSKRLQRTIKIQRAVCPLGRPRGTIPEGPERYAKNLRTSRPFNRQGPLAGAAWGRLLSTGSAENTLKAPRI